MTVKQSFSQMGITNVLMSCNFHEQEFRSLAVFLIEFKTICDSIIYKVVELINKIVGFMIFIVNKF